jgi:hypothetical protein
LIFGTSRSSTGGLGAAPTGWTALRASFDASSSASSHMALYGRILQAGDTDPTVTATSGRIACIFAAVMNHGLTAITDLVTATDINGVQSASITAPSVTPSDATSLLLTGHGWGDPTTANLALTATPPSGMTEVNDVSTSDAAQTDTGVEVASLNLPDGSATGVRTATCSASVNGMGISVAVKSSAAPAAPGRAPQVTSQYTGFF